jgi:hypothetical protein
VDIDPRHHIAFILRRERRRTTTSLGSSSVLLGSHVHIKIVLFFINGFNKGFKGLYSEAFLFLGPLLLFMGKRLWSGAGREWAGASRVVHMVLCIRSWLYQLGSVNEDAHRCLALPASRSKSASLRRGRNVVPKQADATGVGIVGFIIDPSTITGCGEEKDDSVDSLHRRRG